ncbi:hypothetical protein F2Q69_00050200 [Brassica cretica]|uniref:Uncharacterized protein n=1 Tax=Brassica cretica TaxID=69181 RepID=A0A8S9PXU0_BRACR|nr:hypothetical protein F2Q69_00050200 [Brassica cretica]
MTFGFNEILTHDYQRSRVRFSIIGMGLTPEKASLQKRFFSGGLFVSLWLRQGGREAGGGCSRFFEREVRHAFSERRRFYASGPWSHSLGMEVLGSPWFVKLGYSSSLVWCVLVNPFTTAVGCGFEYAVGLVLELCGWLTTSFSPLVLSGDGRVVVLVYLAATLAFGVRSHPSATWVCLSLLWWCAWQLCAGWSQIMEYEDYSSFCSVRHPVQVL